MAGERQARPVASIPQELALFCGVVFVLGLAILEQPFDTGVHPFSLVSARPGVHGRLRISGPARHNGNFVQHDTAQRALGAVPSFAIGGDVETERHAAGVVALDQGKYIIGICGRRQVEVERQAAGILGQPQRLASRPRQYLGHIVVDQGDDVA